MLKVSEIFGPTVQGEGSAAGRHCLFVRLANCNLECSWCDTPYTWAFTDSKAAKTRSGTKYDRAENIHGMEMPEVVAELRQLWDIELIPTIVVVSGGEPLMQRKELVPLGEYLADLNCDIHIETAGTLLPGAELHRLVTQYNVSPKLHNSGNAFSKRYKPEVLKFFSETGRAWFKFVIQSREDFNEVDGMVQDLDLDPQRVMVMPEGTSAEANIETAQRIAAEAIDRGYGISFRTHILLWSNERGR